MIANKTAFVKGEPSLSRFQQQVLAEAFETMGLIIHPSSIHSLLLHHYQDNYYEVLVIGKPSFIVHRQSLKVTLKRIRGFAYAA